MQVASCCILTLPVRRDITPRTPNCVDGLEVREILNLGPAQPSGGFNKLGFDPRSAVGTTGDLDRTTAAVNIFFIRSVKFLELWNRQGIDN